MRPGTCLQRRAKKDEEVRAGGGIIWRSTRYSRTGRADNRLSVRARGDRHGVGARRGGSASARKTWVDRAWRCEMRRGVVVPVFVVCVMWQIRCPWGAVFLYFVCMVAAARSRIKLSARRRRKGIRGQTNWATRLLASPVDALCDTHTWASAYPQKGMFVAFAILTQIQLYLLHPPRCAISDPRPSTRESDLSLASS